MKPALTLEAFADWCEKQPAGKEYRWGSDSNCACAQFARHTGRFQEWDERHDRPTPDGLFLRKRSAIEAYEYPHTFGALATRLRTALSEAVQP